MGNPPWEKGDMCTPYTGSKKTAPKGLKGIKALLSLDHDLTGRPCTPVIPPKNNAGVVKVG
jgi:hypothetical protein